MFPRTGVCVLSIHLFPEDSATNARRSRDAEPLLADLCEQLSAAHIPATWTLAAADLDATSEALSTQLAQGEVALLAERGWAGGQANRGQFAAGLAESLARAAQTGRRPTTLAFEQCPAALHDDLLVKYGISAVCLPPAGRALPFTWQTTLPASGCLRPLRWGLWKLEGAIDLFGVGWRRAAKAIDRAAREAGEVAITINLQKRSGGLKSVARLLEHVTRLNGERQLTSQTLGSLVASRGATRQIAAARSILRSAA